MKFTTTTHLFLLISGNLRTPPQKTPAFAEQFLRIWAATSELPDRTARFRCPIGLMHSEHNPTPFTDVRDPLAEHGAFFAIIRYEIEESRIP